LEVSVSFLGRWLRNKQQPKSHLDELRDHPERFDVVYVKREDNLDDIRVVRKSTGETAAQNLANALDAVEEHPECFDMIEGKDKNGLPVTRYVRKLNGEIATVNYDFSKINRS
jgi:hypothetical protein